VQQRRAIDQWRKSVSAARSHILQSPSTVWVAAFLCDKSRRQQTTTGRKCLICHVCCSVDCPYTHCRVVFKHDQNIACTSYGNQLPVDVLVIVSKQGHYYSAVRSDSHWSLECQYLVEPNKKQLNARQSKVRSATNVERKRVLQTWTEKGLNVKTDRRRLLLTTETSPDVRMCSSK